MKTTATPACQPLTLAPRRMRFDCDATTVFDVLERLASLARRGDLQLIDLTIDRVDGLAVIELGVVAGGSPSGLADPDVVGPIEVFVARLAQLVDVGNLQRLSTPVPLRPAPAAQRLAA